MVRPLRRRHALVLVAGCAVWLPSGALWGHPVHATYAEVEWNGGNGTLEVALRVNPGDLEQALAGPDGKRANLEKDERIDGKILAFLVREFRVTDAEGELLPLRWVGKEVEIKDAWLYFEVVLGERKPEQCSISQDMFLGTHERQINTVRWKVGRAERMLHFTREEPGPVRLQAPTE